MRCLPSLLVTGATGFTGRRVVQALVRDGHRVTAFVRTASVSLTSLPFGLTPLKSRYSVSTVGGLELTLPRR